MHYLQYHITLKPKFYKRHVNKFSLLLINQGSNRTHLLVFHDNFKARESTMKPQNKTRIK